MCIAACENYEQCQEYMKQMRYLKVFESWRQMRIAGFENFEWCQVYMKHLK